MKINKIIAALLFVATGMTGCQKALEYHDVIFFTGTEESAERNMYVDGPASLGVSVTSSCKMGQDINVYIAVDANAVEAYNAEKGTKYKMLPEGSYSLDSDNVTIKADKSVSLPVKFNILSMDDFEEGALYCVPIKITGASNGMDILPTSQMQYIMINQIITTKCPDLNQRDYMSVPTMLGDTKVKNIDACTMEIRVKMDRFYSANSNPGIASVMGVEENFLLRFGDISCEKNQLQLCGGGVSITSKLRFQTGVWYHIAVVDTGAELTLYINGEKDQSVDSSSRSPIDFSTDYCGGFHVGYSCNGSRMMDGCVSEARVWRRALTPIELKNNQCYVDPTSEGLIAYWRMDEVNGEKKCVDLTGAGYDGLFHGTPAWTEGIKCPVVE